MQFIRSIKPFIVSLLLLFFLAACDSAEERAEKYFQNGLELMESGDYDRAMVEFRNVFELNGSHFEARHKLAEILLQHKKQPRRAYGQYLRIAEQYPEDLRARIELAELAFSLRNWEEVERHGGKAEELDPANSRVQILTVARAYQAAAQAEDNPTRREAARKAMLLLEDQPDSVILRNLYVDAELREGNYSNVLEGTDWLIERFPETEAYWQQKLVTLAQMEDRDAILELLHQMVDQFPDQPRHKSALLGVYISQNDTAGAEAFLRELVANADEGDAGPLVDLIRFRSEIEGLDAAIAETDAAIAQGDPSKETSLRAIRAGLLYDKGERETAVQELESILAGAEPSEEINSIKVNLAMMSLEMGNGVGARARVEEVLANDPNNPSALKLRARWLIEADDTEGAISALRTALDADSNDPNAMTLMAQAHTRAGRSELAQEFLALAVETSGNAPAETIRYANLLISEERYLPAEDLLLAALRKQPQNTDILLVLGRLYLQSNDMSRVQQVAATLRRFETEAATQAALGLEAQRINLQSGVDDAVGYLEGIAAAEDATLTSKVALVRARLSVGNVEAALSLSQELLEQEPENVGLKAMLASVESLNGNFPRAEALMREILAEDDQASRIWLELSQLRVRQADQEGAVAILQEGLAAMPNDPGLLWAQASYFERENNIDDAIAIYEKLYENDTGSLVIANNLASLLSTYREDDESLDRAWVIARRFRETETPALQDTYGWIAHRRGDSETALPYLEAAAAGLQGDALVQYHYGKVLQAVGRNEDAIAQYQTTLEIAGVVDQRDQIADAREQLQILQSASEN